MVGKQLKRLILVVMTLIMTVLLSSSLLSSLGEAQVTDRLQLYQTDLLLHVTELSEDAASGTNLSQAQKALLGDKPVESALQDYQKVRQSAEKTLNKLQAQLQQLTGPLAAAQAVEVSQLQSALQQQQDLISQLDLRIGILQAEQNKPEAAIDSWTKLTSQLEIAPASAPWVKTARVLTGLWSEPPRLLPDAEPLLEKQLEGWFRYQALSRLYQLQQRSDALTALESQEQAIAQQTVVKLALVGVLPTLAGGIGFILLIILVARWLIRQQPASPDAIETYRWDVPWDWDIILQVLVFGFFVVGQIVLPLLAQLFGISFAVFGSRAKAIYTLSYYLLMASSGLAVLYLSLKPYFPLPEGWFRLQGKRNWFVWGLGGYFVALPLMLGVSLVNQQIWQGQGGSNPLLQTVLEEGDTVALSIFFITAAIAAPIFEEILFRGFLLPSLTKYVPVWGAIGLSSLLFAIAHLSLSEVLPLAMLGAVLGFVYTRSRSLLAPIMLHSLWNSVTMVGLLLLGSGNN